MSYSLISVDGTATDIISIDEINTHLRLDGTSEDTYISALLEASLEFIEHETDRDFIEKTYDEIRPCFPRCKGEIYLKKPPLKTVTSVKYYDTSNVLQTWDAANYIVRTPSVLSGYIVPAANIYWPSTIERDDAVTIRYTTSPTIIPATLKHCIKLLCGLYYENREAETPINLKPIVTAGVQRLIDQLSLVVY